MMARPNNPKPKQRAVGGLAGLSKAQAEANKRIKAMTPTQRKAYQAQNKKNAIKVAATAASMIPAGRAAVVGGKIASKAIASKAFKNKLYKELSKGVGNKSEREIVNQMAKSWDKTLKNTGSKFIGGNRKKAYQLAAEEYEFNSPKIGQALKSKGPKDLAKMEKALKNSKPPKKTTEASLPSPVARENAYAREYNKRLNNKRLKK